MTNPKISFVMITARTDHPYLNRPDLHLFDPTLESFKNQSLTDFEWVVVDVLYDQRKDFFKKLELPFTVKHVPALPNTWIEKGFPGICRQYNKGIIYADGELLFFTGEGYMVLPDFMSNMWKRYREGYFSLAWYFYDNSFSPMQYTDETRAANAKIAYPEKTVSPIKYDVLGYTGKNVSLEHRYVQTFKNTFRQMFSPTFWQWWFGCSSASREAMLQINGFDHSFDGDRMLLDCDVGSRLEMAGYGSRFAMFRDCLLIRAPSDPNLWNPNFKKDRVTIKCNYDLMWHSRYHSKYEANKTVLTTSDVEWMKQFFCAKHCPIRELCKKEHPWQYPFIHKAGYPGHNSSKKWFNFWLKNQEVIDLESEREKRIEGNPKYMKGTFVEAK